MLSISHQFNDLNKRGSNSHNSKKKVTHVMQKVLSLENELKEDIEKQKNVTILEQKITSWLICFEMFGTG